MRLINVTTFQLSEFWGDAIPPYAILSHRWGEEEVSFEQFSFSPATAERMKGIRKIKYCAAQAKKEDIDWCWVDTCCIDKRSSSELSEAINSMYQWYHNAECCYAYLEDITYEKELESLMPAELVVESKWFSRGWTLQELIAPKKLNFYSSSWVDMGQRSISSELISRRCGIDRDILDGKSSIDGASVAQRMRWASNRETRRVEDVAYCLMGLFDVNMPLLYGEGRKAFIRLQEEIIKRSGDQSIFSWIDESATRTTLRGLLARTPNEFRHCNNMRRVDTRFTIPFEVTNMGLHISLPIRTIDIRSFRRVEYMATLGCRSGSDEVPEVIRLRRTHKSSDQFIRVDPHVRFHDGPPGDSIPTALYVLDKIANPFNVKTRIAAVRLNIETIDVEQCGIWAPYGLRRELNEVRFDLDRKQRNLPIRLVFRPLRQTSSIHYQRILVIVDCDLWACLAGKLDASFANATVVLVDASYDINKEPPKRNLKESKPGNNLLGLNKKRAVVGDEIIIIVTMRVSYRLINEA
ncbi:hypothetical protein HBH56_191330 [Parastagonospora nodorum]|uniref:Heterokaryon incompatibility domain-containing protein n=1 Tax=Phaeosphaeria nodorum (strain SN15 / ATCC MYA-4574 / FGSC 10173) TaxID=321614 RepID=A0A7U2FD72_PHANO|nr:hypothetical protein HBH56_191330 [Parastagonospora nodorum]QRD03122.1 hypothetical protein JI435_141160 [Parastagonospora nodorum SN15]KAH3937811.1 hypothetical protein HBH54_010670 [Parastagonospora nodorum]KAH3940715.1 hypothetical protein HBH53_211670 [Parastagonospora nodorum]KAH3966557.1 hypothetical protein HBH52_199690 [Parastagonospora nodorum]